jgi:hypothetical protein
MRGARILGLASILAFVGCNPCERSGCDAANRPASGGIDQGIVGVVAIESDAGENGCFKCPFSSTSLGVWRAADPVGDVAAAAALTQAGPPMLTINANERYRQHLDTGNWLVCPSTRGGACAAVTIAAGHVVTVNVRMVFGPPVLVVFEAGKRRDSGVFSIAERG